MNCPRLVVNNLTFHRKIPLNFAQTTLSRPPLADGEIRIGKSVEATFNYTGSKGWNWAGMKCFLCIDFSLHLRTHWREGKTIVTFSIAALQKNKGGSMHGPFLLAFFLIQWEHVHQTILLIKLGNAIELKWNSGRSGKRPHKHFTLIEFWCFLWSVLTSAKLWLTSSVDFCDFDDKVWQGLWMDPLSSFSFFTLGIYAHFRYCFQ